MQSEESIEAKQNFLREAILDKGFDPNVFLQFLIMKKGENGGDVANWSMNELSLAVQEFMAMLLNQVQLQQQMQSDPNLNQAQIQQVQPAVVPNPQMQIVDPSQTPTIVETNQPELKQENTQNVMPGLTENNNNNDKQQQNLPQQKLPVEMYGIIGSETINCQQIEATPITTQKDTFITVGSPEKVEGRFFSKGYITYLIKTSPLNLNVRRRYSDFDWFHQIITILFPSCIIPPTPKKKMGADRFGDAFLQKRARNLEKFLNCLLADPIIRNSQLFYDFLSIEAEAEWTKKKTEYQKQKPPQKLNDYHSMNGIFNVGVKEEKEIYYDNIKDNIMINETLLTKLNLSLKQLKMQMDLTISKVEEVAQNWNELCKTSEKYFDEKNIIRTYSQMNKLFINWSNALKKENDLIFVHVREYFKYSKNYFRDMKDIIQKVETNKNIYNKSARNLIAKKEDLFRRGDVTKWELDPNEKAIGSQLKQDKFSALYKMCQKDTNNTIQLRIIYGFYLNRMIEEFERIRELSSKKHTENQMFFCKELTEILSDFHKEVADNYTSLAIEKAQEKIQEQNENKNDNNNIETNQVQENN